jgi:hypothetical protein
MKKIINWLLTPYRRYKEKKAFEARLEELRKRDPFIYK